MFIYLDAVYSEDSSERDVIEIIISKQRSGPTGIACVAFSLEFARFPVFEEHREVEAVFDEDLDSPDPGNCLF